MPSPPDRLSSCRDAHPPDLGARVQEWFKMPSQGTNFSLGLPAMILLPLAGAAKLFHWNAAIVLVVNIVAIIFLSEAISVSSDELADHLGELQGALLSATFGNTVELTVSYSRELPVSLGPIMLAWS